MQAQLKAAVKGTSHTILGVLSDRTLGSLNMFIADASIFLLHILCISYIL